MWRPASTVDGLTERTIYRDDLLFRTLSHRTDPACLAHGELRFADADPGPGHSPSARRARPSGYRPDGHRQDGGLRPADPAAALRGQDAGGPQGCVGADPDADARTRHPDRRETALLFFFQAEDGIRGYKVTGVQTCALPIS